MPTTTTKVIPWMPITTVFAVLTGSLVLSSGKLQEYLVRTLESLKYKTEGLKESNRQMKDEIKKRKRRDL